MKIKLRTCISGLFYIMALISFVEAILVSSGGFLDFSDLARLVFCGLAVIFVIAATLIWKAKDACGKRNKIIVMVITIVVIIGGGTIDYYLNNNTQTHEYTGNMLKISESIAAKFETADGKSIIIDEEVDLLTSIAELELQETPMTPADDPEDWIYRITYNPSEIVPDSEEIIVFVHEKYLQIETEYYLPIGNESFAGVLEMFHGLANYFFE